MEDVYKRNSVIERHLALCVKERESKTEGERAQYSCIPPAPGTVVHPTRCTAALLARVSVCVCV